MRVVDLGTILDRIPAGFVGFKEASDGKRRQRTCGDHAVNPQGVFCANPACADRGAANKGKFKGHSRKERRIRRIGQEQLGRCR